MAPTAMGGESEVSPTRTSKGRTNNTVKFGKINQVIDYSTNTCDKKVSYNKKNDLGANDSDDDYFQPKHTHSETVKQDANTQK